MTQRSAGGPGGPRWPGQPGGGTGGEWPDELWPDDDPAPPPDAAGPRGRRPWWRRQPAMLAAVIVTAGLAGAGIPVALHDLAGPAEAAPRALPSSLPGGQGGGRLPARRGGPGGLAGGTVRMMLAGRVSAVSAAAITIGGPGHVITAAVTGSTRVTGTVTGLSGIKVGDLVSAQLTRTAGRIVAVAIQDPAQPPPGGPVP